MVDNLNPDRGHERARAPEPAARAAESAPEREVTLFDEGRPTVAVHQWLDGEVSEAVARRANSAEVDLWRRIGEETTRRSRMVTPAPVLDRIMAAIPETAPAARKPWWQGPAPFSTAVALAGGAALLVLGGLLGGLVK